MAMFLVIIDLTCTPVFAGTAEADVTAALKALQDETAPEITDVTALLKVLNHENAEIRRLAAHELANLGAAKKLGAREKEVIAAMKRLLKDKDMDVRHSAAVGLTRIDSSLSREVKPFLVEAVKEHSSYALDALATLGDMGPEAGDAVPVLIEAMRRNPKYTANYWIALKYIGTPEALKAIEPLERSRARWQNFYSRVDFFLGKPLLDFVIGLVFGALFWWSRARSKGGIRIFYRPLLIPAACWGLLALYETPWIDQMKFYLYPSDKLLLLGIATMTGLVPWSFSWLWLWWQERHKTNA